VEFRARLRELEGTPRDFYLHQQREPLIAAVIESLLHQP
jgi:hypothetical protein